MHALKKKSILLEINVYIFTENFLFTSQIKKEQKVYRYWQN